MSKFFKYINYIFKFIFGYPLYFISGFVPRNKNIWVFGSFGIFNDNSRYLYQYIVNNPQLGIEPIWISSNTQSVEEASQYGKAYRKISLKGLYYSLIAKVYIFSSYVSDINFFTSRNAITVNLWHGIPLKKIEFDIRTEPLVKVFHQANIVRKIVSPAIHMTKYDFVLSPSQYVADYSFKSAFRIKDENIIVAGYPRVSYLKECEPLVEYQRFNKVFLYAPTWRDDGRNFLAQAQFDFLKLNNLMQESNSIFLMKLHSATKLDVDLSSCENLKLLPNNIDPMRLMKSADCLITDYSSIYLDYLVLDRPIIHFCFDLVDYLKNREMYFDYKMVVAGDVVESFEMLMKIISDILSNTYNDQKKQREFQCNKFFLDSHKSNNFIINEIISGFN